MSKVIIYSKDHCPYCDRAKQLLTHKGAAYEELRVDLQPELMEQMLAQCAGRRTFPQIVIGDRPIGGFDDMWQLEQDGLLDELLT